MIPNSQNWLVVTSGGLQTLLQERISVSRLLMALSSQELATVSQKRTGAPQQRGGGCHWGCAPQQKALGAWAELMLWDSSAMGTPVSVLNLQLLWTGTRADRPQAAKGCVV